MKTYDFVIIGAGIVGLTIARALAAYRYGSVLILEKEHKLGCHASGRNSGVLHTGIYYAPGSLKARMCAEGARRLFEYASEHGIAVRRSGKVIVATSQGLVPVVDFLCNQATANGAKVEKISVSKLREIEPEAATEGEALFSPNTAVIDSQGVLTVLEREISSLGVYLIKSAAVCSIDVKKRIVKTSVDSWQYGHLINAAGLHADRIAHWMGAGERYRILPFKGIYKKLKPNVAGRFRGSIYPVPNLSMPFLGVHLTKTVYGEVIVGPTAIPALGRENYGVFGGLNFKDLSTIAFHLLTMTVRGNDGIRQLIKEETAKYSFRRFVECAQKLAPALRPDDFVPDAEKVGIRAQLVDAHTKRFVLDFVVETGPHSTHILNAVSPAFTSSFPFADFVVSQLTSRTN